MQIKKSQLTATRIKLTIEADEPFLAKVKKTVLEHMSREHVKLAGFRAGKAPLSLIEKQVDPVQLQREFLDEAVNRLYGQIVRSEKIRPIENPTVNLKKFVPFTTLEVEIEVEAIGEIKLPDYKHYKKVKPTVTVNAAQVEDVINGLAYRLAERQTSNEPSQKDDEVIIDFKGTDEKQQPINGADGTAYPLILGSEAFIPGFETHLIGLKAGEEKTFPITFPKDYSAAALQSKKVTFWVKVNQVNHLVVPKIDDSFAAKAGPFPTLKELKADIKKQLELEKQQQIDRDFENSLVQDLAGKTEVAIPEALINDQVARSEEAEKQNLMYRGQTWQEHLTQEGVTEEEHRQRNRPDATLNVKAGLMLAAIAEAESIAVTPEELEIRIQLLKGQYQDAQMRDELDKSENRDELANRLLTEKTVSKLVTYLQK